MTTRRELLQSAMALSAISMTGLSPLMAFESVKKAAKPLKILMLGGTGFLGPHTVQYAIDRGHEVTLFNRGRSKENLFPELEKLIGNRDPEVDAGLSALKGRKWDCVIDTSSYVPRIAGASAQLLKGQCEQYLMISTISVYSQFSQLNMDESAAVGTLDDPTVETVDGATYGPLKAYSEQAVTEQFGAGATILRPGLIVGPRDRTDRYSYWPVRASRGGDMLCPGNGSDLVQYIDVRDLAEFIVHCLEQKTTGIFNTISDSKTETVKDMVDTCIEVSGADTNAVWADTDFLTEQGVRPWADMPVWVPNAGEMAGLSQIDVSRAFAAGMKIRDRKETALDTLNWFKTLPEERQKTLRAGIKSEREQEVLAEWFKREKSTVKKSEEIS
ncbi:MAG: NAD-dependent epimerase/dehydratase family protein [Gammaproteobacteria bacterium]|jgi:2'-hydroxyisoflavone reductase